MYLGMKKWSTYLVKVQIQHGEDFECGVVVGSGWPGLSTRETADLLRFFLLTISRVSRENTLFLPEVKRECTDRFELIRRQQ